MCGNTYDDNQLIADHITEIADGGDPHDHAGNGQALCDGPNTQKCNTKKTAAAAVARRKANAARREANAALNLEHDSARAARAAVIARRSRPR